MLVSRARALGTVRLHPIGAITVGQKGEQLTEMADLKDAGAVAVSDDGRCVTNSQVMRRALEYATTFDLPLIQHAEDHALTEGAQMHEGAVSTRLGLRGWPRVAEDVIVARDVLLAEYVGARYHVAHVSTMGAVRLVREAKARGATVTAEVTPHHLLLTDQALLGYDTACKVNPPLREPEDVEALRRALADGTIDCVATDHAPHAHHEKEVPFEQAPMGTTGLETAFAALYTELVLGHELELAILVERMTAGGALYGLPVPVIGPGELANVTLVDLDAAWDVGEHGYASRSQNCCFHGRKLHGRVLLTVAAGAIAFRAPMLAEAKLPA
jgi:dihydroorotase